MEDRSCEPLTTCLDPGCKAYIWQGTSSPGSSSRSILYTLSQGWAIVNRFKGLRPIHCMVCSKTAITCQTVSDRGYEHHIWGASAVTWLIVDWSKVTKELTPIDEKMSIRVFLRVLLGWIITFPINDIPSCPCRLVTSYCNFQFRSVEIYGV